MPASDVGTEPSAERLLKTLNAHLESVQAIYERVIHAQQPMYYTIPEAGPADNLGQFVLKALPVGAGFGKTAGNSFPFQSFDLEPPIKKTHLVGIISFKLKQFPVDLPVHPLF